MGDTGAHSRLLGSDVVTVRRRSETVIATPPVHFPAKVDTSIKPREFRNCGACRGTGRGHVRHHRAECPCVFCARPCKRCRGTKVERREVDPAARKARRTRGVEVGEEDRRW